MKENKRNQGTKRKLEQANKSSGKEKNNKGGSNKKVRMQLLLECL